MTVSNAGRGCREKVSLINFWWKCKMIYTLCKIPNKFNKIFKNKNKMSQGGNQFGMCKEK